MTSRAEVQAEVERRIAAGGIVSAADAKRIKYFFIGLRRKQFPRPRSHFGVVRYLCTKRHYGRM
jgi:hypothetical protein